MGVRLFKALAKRGFDIVTQHHADAILRHDMPQAIEELTSALLEVTIPVEELIRGGGGEAGSTQRIRRSLDKLSWKKHTFLVEKTVDGVRTESQTHEIDHVRRFPGGTIALEIEWNNKDPFYDRDLENFKRLHSEGAISVGAILTRGLSLQAALREVVYQFALDRDIRNHERLRDFYFPTQRQLRLYEIAEATEGSFARGWAGAFVSDKFGEATTHWRKLEERVQRGVGNPCPLILIGLPAQVITR